MADFTPKNEFTNLLADAQKNGIKVEEILQKAVLKMITLKDEDFVFTKLGLNENEVIGANKGTSTISFVRYNPLTVDLDHSRLVEGEANAPLRIGGHKVSATLEEHGAWVQITSAMRDVHLHDIQAQYLPDLQRHANETKERIALRNINAEASVRFVGDKENAEAITDEDILTLEDVKLATLSFKTNLRRPHRKYGNKWVIVTPDHVMFDLLKDPEIRDQMIIGKENAPLERGTLTEYTTYNTKYISSTMLSNEAKANESGVHVFDSYAIADGAYITTTLGKNDFDWHIVPFEASKSDPLGRTASFGYTMKFGAKVIDPLAIINIKSASTYGVPSALANDLDIVTKPAPVTAEQIKEAQDAGAFPKAVKEEDKFPLTEKKGK